MDIFWNILNILNIIFILFVVFFERKEDSQRMAWLLALIFLPGIGMLLYILLSGHFFTQKPQLKKINQYSSKLNDQFISKQLSFFQEEKDIFNNKFFHDNHHLINMNLSHGKSLLTVTDSIKIYRWGQDMFADLKKDLEAATESIFIESFIFHNDKIGTEIMDILCRKAEQGLTVKLLYDDMGSITTRTKFFERLDKAGGTSLAFSPIRWRLPLTINFRNHRKNTIIDGKIGYMGGVNIGDEYANQSKKKRKPLWRDTHIRITGDSVLFMQKIFLIDWFTTPAWKTRLRKLEDITKYFPESIFNGIKEKISPENDTNLSLNIFTENKIPTQIITAGPDDIHITEIEDALIRMIMSAKNYVYIQTPYFTPDIQFVNALKIAASSGVDVRIMVPGKWDKSYVRAAAYEFIREVMDYGITFYHYNGFIHSKTLVSDDKVVTIGSTNIDTRSFELHFEMNAIFYDKNLAIENKNIFLDDIKNSQKAEKEWFDTRFFLRRAIWFFCKLFSSLM